MEIENINDETALMVPFLRTVELSESEACKNARVSHHTLNVLDEAIKKLEKESKTQKNYLHCLETSHVKKLEILKQEQADEVDE